MDEKERLEKTYTSLQEICSSPSTMIITEQQADKKADYELYKKTYELAVNMEKKLKEANKIPVEKAKADGTIRQSECWCGIIKENGKYVPKVSFRNGGELLCYKFTEEMKLKDITYCYNSFKALDKTKTLALYQIEDRPMKESLKAVYEFFTGYKKAYEDTIRKALFSKPQVSEEKVRSYMKTYQNIIKLESHNKAGDISLSDVEKTDKGYSFFLRSEKENAEYRFHMNEEGKVDKIDYKREDIPAKFIGFSDATLNFYARELSELDISKSRTIRLEDPVEDITIEDSYKATTVGCWEEAEEELDR